MRRRVSGMMLTIILPALLVSCAWLAWSCPFPFSFPASFFFFLVGGVAKAASMLPVLPIRQERGALELEGPPPGDH